MLLVCRTFKPYKQKYLTLEIRVLKKGKRDLHFNLFLFQEYCYCFKNNSDSMD